MKRLFFIGISCLLVIISCENELDIPLDNNAKKLTLNVELSPYDKAKALVSLTNQPLEAANYPIPKDAIVELYEEGKFIEFLQYNPEDTSRINGIYEGTLVPQPGLNYQIKVNKTGFNAIEASDQMPPQIQVKDLVLAKYPQVYTDGKKAQITFTFDDPALQNNYYQLFVYYFFKVKTESDGEDSIAYNYIFNLDKTINIASPQMVDYSNGILFSDENFDGTTARLQLTFDAEPLENYRDPKYRQAAIFFELRAISQNNYQYRRTLTLSRRKNNDGFSEPVLVWNNILNGLGIMCSYTRDFKVLDLK
jgi:hypothetical protein